MTEKLIIRTKISKSNRRDYGYLNLTAIGNTGHNNVMPQEIRLVFINRYGSTIMKKRVENIFNKMKKLFAKDFDLVNVANRTVDNLQRSRYNRK